MVERRLIRLASVGLMVRAPRPVAWDAWWLPGMTEALLLFDEGVVPRPLPPARGDFGARVDKRFCSGVKVLPGIKFA